MQRLPRLSADERRTKRKERKELILKRLSQLNLIRHAGIWTGNLRMTKRELEEELEKL